MVCLHHTSLILLLFRFKQCIHPSHTSHQTHVSHINLDASGVHPIDKGTQTSVCMDMRPKPFMDASFPKKKTHPISHKVMLLSAVLSLAQKQKISGEVESTLLYYVSLIPCFTTHSYVH